MSLKQSLRNAILATRGHQTAYPAPSVGPYRPKKKKAAKTTCIPTKGGGFFCGMTEAPRAMGFALRNIADSLGRVFRLGRRSVPRGRVTVDPRNRGEKGGGWRII